VEYIPFPKVAETLLNSFRLILVLVVIGILAQGTLAQQPIQPATHKCLHLRPIEAEDIVQQERDSLEYLLGNQLAQKLAAHGVQLTADSSVCDLWVHITLEKTSTEKYLVFFALYNSVLQQRQTTAKFSSATLADPLMLDTWALALRKLLFDSYVGLLSISSVPSGAFIFLNDHKIGQTPAELLLPAATYTVQLRAEHLREYTDTVTVSSESRVSVSKRMELKSGWSAPLVIAASVATIGGAIATVLAHREKSDYERIPRFRSEENGYSPIEQATYDEAYSRYNRMSIVRNSALGCAGALWSWQIGLIVKKRALEQKLFEQYDVSKQPIQ